MVFTRSVTPCLSPVQRAVSYQMLTGYFCLSLPQSLPFVDMLHGHRIALPLCFRIDLASDSTKPTHLSDTNTRTLCRPRSFRCRKKILQSTLSSCSLHRNPAPRDSRPAPADRHRNRVMPHLPGPARFSTIPSRYIWGYFLLKPLQVMVGN